MKIYVCVKQIPDPNTVVSRLDPNTKRLVRSGVSLVLDPGDEVTIAAAIKLRDTVGNSEVTVVSMGPASAQEALRRALAMGVDRAILVSLRQSLKKKTPISSCAPRRAPMATPGWCPVASQSFWGSHN
jgi:electron transfer flavoprotein alpha/beta subunit